MINQLTQQPITPEELQNISKLAEQQLFLEGQIEIMEKDLSDKQEKLKELSEHLLPDAMTNVGMESFTLFDGTAIHTSTFYSASIPKDRTMEAFKWLRENNFAEIIKREVKCNFGKGEDAIANLAIQALRAMNLEPQDKESVHPQTLKAFVREQLEEAKPLPTDLFGVYVGKRTKLTPSNK